MIKTDQSFCSRELGSDGTPQNLDSGEKGLQRILADPCVHPNNHDDDDDDDDDDDTGDNDDDNICFHTMLYYDILTMYDQFSWSLPCWS